MTLAEEIREAVEGIDAEVGSSDAPRAIRLSVEHRVERLLSLLDGCVLLTRDEAEQVKTLLEDARDQALHLRQTKVVDVHAAGYAYWLLSAGAEPPAGD